MIYFIVRYPNLKIFIGIIFNKFNLYMLGTDNFNIKLLLSNVQATCKGPFAVAIDPFAHLSPFNRGLISKALPPGSVCFIARMIRFKT